MLAFHTGVGIHLRKFLFGLLERTSWTTFFAPRNMLHKGFFILSTDTRMLCLSDCRRREAVGLSGASRENCFVAFLKAYRK